MLSAVWLWGFVATGSPKQATHFLRAWWRVVKWLALAGLVLGLLMLDIIPPQ